MSSCKAERPPESPPSPSAPGRTWHGAGAIWQIFGEVPSRSNRKSPHPRLRTVSSRCPMTRLLWVAHLSDVRHAGASVTFPYHAFRGWFPSSPFSLSVLENHKETPCCSWNSCQRDSSGIEHMEPCPLHKQRCCYFQLNGLLSLPAWVLLA